MADLFISYSSHDRPWAERLFNDLASRFPTIKLFWDRVSIPPGENFRHYLEREARTASHFAVFWSAAAKESGEVGPEIQAFRENVQTSSTAKNRRLFYVELEKAVPYGPLTPDQGFTDFYDTYLKDAPDRGISGLDGPAGVAWNRMVGMIGNAVLADQPTKPITLALLVMRKKHLEKLGDFADDRNAGGPSLNEFLQAAGLTAADLEERYGDTAFAWRPFGRTKTVIDLMEDVREMANRNIETEYRFHWRPMDFVEELRTVPDIAAGRRLIKSLSDELSVIVTDPISLFNPVVNLMFKRLSEYAKKPQSMILSISPSEMQAADRLVNGLISNSSPMLDPHLVPQIPATEAFALCGMNLQHIWDIERVIKSGLGYYYLQQKKAEAQPLASSGR